MKDTQNQLKQIQKELDEAQKQAEAYQKEKTDDSETNDTSNIALTKEEQEAFEQVNKAKAKGEKLGAEAAAKIFEQQQGQSEQENVKQFSDLKKKLESTSLQV